MAPIKKSQPVQTRRRFLETGIAAVVGVAAGFGANELRHSWSEKEKPSSGLTIEDATEAYEKLEKLIVAELEKAEAEKKCLKIMVGDEHYSATSLLNLLMVFDITKRHGIRRVAFEYGPDDEISLQHEVKLKGYLGLVDSPSYLNIQNFHSYIEKLNKNAPKDELVSYHAIEDQQIRNDYLKLMAENAENYFKDWDNPIEWKAAYEDYAKKYVDFLQKRNKPMAKNILADNSNEMVVCGQDHLVGLSSDIGDSKKARFLYISAYPGICHSPEKYANATLNRELPNIDPIKNRVPTFSLGRKISYPEAYAMRDKFIKAAQQAFKDERNLPYFQDSLKFMRDKTHPTFESDLPAQNQSIRHAVKMFQGVKKRLKHQDADLVGHLMQGLGEESKGIV